MSDQALRAAIVGCGGMGRAHGSALASLPEFRVVAGCDLSNTLMQQFTETIPGTTGYTDYATMLHEERPDVVVIATNTAAHAPLTILAAEAGVRGVYCEKPMAINLADGRAMVAACQRNSTALVVNHQRRTMPVFRTMRKLIDNGTIGDVELIRGSGGGDILSDGTHLVDTIRYFMHDAEVEWVFAQVYRDPPKVDELPSQGFKASGGWRYGHPVETGGMTILQFANGVRAELFTGTLLYKGGYYQDYQIFGTQGRLHRNNDWADPPLLIQTNTSNGWQPVPIEELNSEEARLWTFQQFARMVTDGAEHPLNGLSALKDLEIIMAIYESARLRTKITLPLDQPRFPLEIMIENGEM